MDSFEQIRKDIKENDVVLYMKGTSDFPQCGFSGLVVSILKDLNIKFKFVDVLESDEIRQSIKRFSNWPTIPQLYIKGDFVGGCDIIREMYERGELRSLLEEKKVI
ncbi:MAG: Grx4 family monothiol glutaredoxin [Wolbachia endosymbiont of Menacanthus eurysternus]|nr:MAG: Grx4 family monothiol glutaredoxin [Wolbachia endosymbiont of Menacanthus eurysternus]